MGTQWHGRRPAMIGGVILLVIAIGVLVVVVVTVLRGNQPVRPGATATPVSVPSASSGSRVPSVSGGQSQSGGPQQTGPAQTGSPTQTGPAPSGTTSQPQPGQTGPSTQTGNPSASPKPSGS